MATRGRCATSLAVVLLLGCGETTGTPPAASAASPGPAARSEAPGAPHALPALITADVVLPGPLPDRHVLVTIDLGSGLPWTISGCVSPGGAPCEESARALLDEAARTELVTAIDEVRAIPRCEPEPIFPDDRPYTLTLTGFPRTYTGGLPGDASAMATRNAGPCRADARLSWWIASHFEAGAAAPAGPASGSPPLPELPES